MAEKPAAKTPSAIHRSSIRHGPDRRAALENMALLLAAGVDVSTALVAATQSTTSAAIRKRLTAANDAVQGGIPLWKALSDQGLLTTHQAWLVRSGEDSGTLANHVMSAVEYERQEESFRRRLTSALMYPGIVTSIALVVGLSIAWFVLPRLVTVFSSLRVTLPLPTRILLAVGKFLAQNGYWAVPLALAVFAGVFYLFFLAPRSKWVGQTVLLNTPGFGKLIREIEIARFGSVVSSLLNAGVQIPEALEALADAAAFHPYPRLYGHLHQRVLDGQTMAEALNAWPNSRKHLPQTVQEIIAVAEQTGSLALATTRISETYQLRLETSAKDLIAIIEPLMLFVVWIGVVGLAAAVVTPIYSVLQGVNR